MGQPYKHARRYGSTFRFIHTRTTVKLILAQGGYRFHASNFFCGPEKQIDAQRAKMITLLYNSDEKLQKYCRNDSTLLPCMPLWRWVLLVLMRWDAAFAQLLCLHTREGSPDRWPSKHDPVSLHEQSICLSSTETGFAHFANSFRISCDDSMKLDYFSCSLLRHRKEDNFIPFHANKGLHHHASWRETKNLVQIPD